MGNKLVSVIITTYGKSSGLKRAIQSVLDQDYINVEIIVVDDNGRDTENQKNNAETIRSINDDKIVYCIHEKNMNGSTARNTGLNVAKGEYISFLDDDDFYFPKRLSLLIEAIENSHGKYQGAYSDVLIMESESILGVSRAKKSGNLLNDLLMNNALVGTGSNLFFTKEAVDKIGLFDISFKRFQDVEYLMRFFHHFCICAVSKPLVVKDCMGRNYPDFNDYYSNFDHFTEKFIDDINNLSKDKKDIYYTTAYSNGLKIAAMTGRKKNIDYAESRLTSVRPLATEEISIKKNYKFISSFEMIKCSIKKFSFTSAIYKKLLRVKRMKKHKAILNSLKDKYILK